MIKQKQIIVDRDNGDCFRTCVACLFDLKPEEVPHFIEKETWFLDFEHWLRERGYTVDYIVFEKDPLKKWLKPDNYYMVSGWSPNFDGAFHVVIYRGNRRYWDVSPSNKFLKGKPRSFYRITKTGE